MEKINEYLINKIFTIPYIDKMIDENMIPDSFVQCVRRYVKKDDGTIGGALSEIYHYMNDKYRNEYFYKNTIFNQLLLDKHDIYRTAALSELPIAESKADFVMINGRGIVYEIKTDLDNLSRLKNQISDYYKVFSYIYVVVSNKYLEKMIENFRDTKVGIYELADTGTMIQRKKALCDRDHLSYEVMFRILRKHEFESILLKHYKRLPNVNSFMYYRECLKWLEDINMFAFQKDVMCCLKQRTVLTVTELLDNNIPYELRFYAYFSRKYRLDDKAIEAFMSKELEV